MKHLKKLSVVLMMTTLFSVSFTSCIDNEVSPLVEAIYEAQADLIAAQAGVQNAEAALLLAEAQAEEAQANLIAAQTAQVEVYTAGMEADNAYEAAQREQYLLELVAQTNLDVAAAQNALALAQVTFETQMAAATAAMEAAGAQIAAGYAYNYAYWMQHANGLMQDLLEAQTDLANAQLMQNDDVSWEFYLAQLQGDVATEMANKANLEDAIADLEAYIADPSTPEAIISDLKAQNEAYLDAIDAKNVEITEQWNKIMVLYEQTGVRSELEGRAQDALADHNDAVGEKNDRLDLIEAAEDDIEGWQTALDDYAGALATLQTTFDDATDAALAAQDALGVEDANGDVPAYQAYYMVDADGDAIAIGGAKYAVPANLQEVYVNTRIDKLDADKALDDLEDDIAGLFESLQDAVDDLAAEQAIYDSGIDAIEDAVDNAVIAVTDAEDALEIAISDYEAKKAAFELNPAGFVWTAGPNGAIGLHADATTVTASYRVVNLTDNGVGALTLTAGAGADLTGSYGTYAAFLADATAGALAPGDYYDVGTDDIAGGTNADRLNDAIAALGDEDIFDNAPELGDAAYGGGTAYETLWDAQLALIEAQDDLDNFGDNLAAALLAYETQRDLYQDQLILLDAAQLAAEEADDANAEAKSDVDDAWEEFGPTLTALGTPTVASVKRLPGDAVPTDTLGLTEIWYNAYIDLLVFQVCDEDCLQDKIDAALLDIAQWTLEIANIQLIIDAKYAVVAGLLGELTASGAEYTFTVDEDGLGTLVITNVDPVAIGGFATYADLHAAIIAEYQAYWVLQQELDALWNAYYLNDNLIWAYGYWADDLDDLADMLEGLQEDLAEAIYDIEVAEQALAAAQVEEAADEAYLSYLEALIDTLEQRHANTLAIAAKYKALMEAALAS